MQSNYKLLWSSILVLPNYMVFQHKGPVIAYAQGRGVKSGGGIKNQFEVQRVGIEKGGGK